jgi:hypothetical protein
LVHDQRNRRPPDHAAQLGLCLAGGTSGLGLGGGALTHEIAEASYAWRESALGAGQAVVNILTGHAGKSGTAMANWQLQRDRFTTETVTVKDVLPDRHWQMFTSLLPAHEHKRGHTPIDNRVIVAAIIHCEKHHRPWAHVPESLGGSYRTMRERCRQWQRSGHWPEIQAAIEDIINR